MSHPCWHRGPTESLAGESMASEQREPDTMRAALLMVARGMVLASHLSASDWQVETVGGPPWFADLTVRRLAVVSDGYTRAGQNLLVSDDPAAGGVRVAEVLYACSERTELYLPPRAATGLTGGQGNHNMNRLHRFNASTCRQGFPVAHDFEYALALLETLRPYIGPTPDPTVSGLVVSSGVRAGKAHSHLGESRSPGQEIP